jgi:curli biogenesis system outer membrane secretion channel CsgG
MKIKGTFVVLTLFLSGCATTSIQPVAVEGPSSQAQQIKAQRTAQVPSSKRYKLKVAVGRFTNETNYGRSLMADADFDRIGKQASDMLTSRLIQSGQFVVLERTDINKITKEHEISGDARLVGSDTLLIGSVTEFGRSVSGTGGFLSSTKVQTAKAKVDVRLVDVKTGHAYFSAIGAGEANTETGEVAGFGSRAAYDATLNDRAIAAAISDVIDKLVSTLGDRKWKTDILEEKDGQVFISGGKNQGLREGDILSVMVAGDTVKSKQTGFNIPLPPKQVAKIRISEFFGDSETNEGSIGTVVEGSITKPLSPKLFVTESR